MSASNHQGHAPLAGRAGRRPSFPLGAAVAGLAIALSLYSAAPSAEPVGQSPPSADDRPSDDISPSILLDELQSAAREKSERMERLRQELLRLSQWKARAESEASAAEGDASDSGPMTAGSEPQPPEQSPPGEPTSETPPESGDAEHSAALPLPPAADAVTGTAVDRIALGDSLFAIGEPALALQAYTSVELNGATPADRHWVEYQIANCHRRLGNLPEAEKRYRHLAGFVDAEWCAQHARWWLDALERRAALERDLNQIRQAMKSLEEGLDARPMP